MKKIKILDSTFSHSHLGYCSDFQTSEYFKWDRTQSDSKDILVVTDNKLKSSDNIDSKKIAWLIEPVCISPSTYSYIEENFKKFDYVLTHDKKLLDSGNNFNFVPFGCCWVEEDDRKIHQKSKNISIISSEKKNTEGHLMRHEVIRKFGNLFDVYGRGYTSIDKKILGLKDYRYSIVIENCKRDYWFTEKLIDCFATGTIPIYWGCPSIADFFDVNGILTFDNLDELENILKICDENHYQKVQKSVFNNFIKSSEYLLPDNFVYNFIEKNYEFN